MGPSPEESHGIAPWLVVAILGALPWAGCSTEKKRPPEEFSVVLVTLDTTRADRIGAFGGTAVPTPHLDRAAEEGTRFLAAFAQAPLTLPSHSSLLTGRYPASHGVRHNGVYKLPDSEETLAERLSERGFRTAAFVGAFVLDRGFGLEQGFATYGDIDTSQSDRDDPFDSRRSADEVNAAAFDWLDHRPQGRFFLWIHYYDAHDPYDAPDKPGSQLSGTGYDRCISYIDAAFGDVVARLRRDGLLDDVLLVVAGDHGESLGDHREVTHGVFLYEAAVRVPLLFRAPGLVPAQRIVEGPVELTDVAPTVLALLDLPPLARAEGVSLVPAIERRADPVGPVYAETLMPRIEFGWSELRMVRDGRYKYIEAPHPELYDLRADPGELHNLLTSDSRIAQDMAADLADWVERTSSAEAEPQARHALSAEQQARLESLGYLGSLADPVAPDTELPDPKDHLVEGQMIYESRELLAAGNTEEALRLFDEVLRRNPANHLARTSKIQALVRLARLEEAEAEALAAVELASHATVDYEPQMDKARRTLASIYSMRGKSDETSAGDWDTPFKAAKLARERGDPKLAVRLFRLAAERKRDDPEILGYLGTSLLAAGDLDGAQQTLEKVERLRPEEPRTYFYLGNIALLRNEEAKARELMDRCLELEPDFVGARLNLARWLGDRSRFAEAEQIVRAAIERDPDDPEARGLLEQLQALAGQDASASR